MDDTKAHRLALMRSYRSTFTGQDGGMVLRDLAGMAFFNASTVSTDPYTTYLHEGWRQCYLYILSMMSMEPDALVELATQPDFDPLDTHFMDIQEDKDE